MIKDIVQNVKKQRGERIRLVRDTLRLSRKVLCEKHEKYGLSAGTIQSWEEARWGGLTEKGAEKLAQAFQDEGVDVTVTWLMDGIGQSPVNLRLLNQTEANVAEKGTIAYEIRLFHELHENVVDMLVIDDGMLPCLQPGDHVAGKRYQGNRMQYAAGLPCIVELASGEMLVRLLQFTSSNGDGCFNLLCSNPNTTVPNPTIVNAQLNSVAPILWIRKPGIMR